MQSSDTVSFACFVWGSIQGLGQVVFHRFHSLTCALGFSFLFLYSCRNDPGGKCDIAEIRPGMSVYLRQIMFDNFTIKLCSQYVRQKMRKKIYIIIVFSIKSLT